jgi:hypothetical protein
MNGGSGAMPMANMPAGRAMAAVSPSSLDPASGFRSEGFRSDLFYKTRGKEAPRAASRLVQVDPNCKPTKNKRCAMKSISVASSGGRKGCDGDPQCILKLTGKLNLPKLSKAGENFPQMQMAGTAQGDANGVRGVASVQGSSRRTLPEGVWRGTQNLLVHIDNYFGKHLQLDHEGLLVVDED